MGMYVSKLEELESRRVEDPEAEGVTSRTLGGGKLGNPNFDMRHFTVAPGGHTSFRACPWETEIFVLSGRGKALRMSGETEIGPGSFVFVPPGEEHGLANNGDEPLSYLCVIPAAKYC